MDHDWEMNMEEQQRLARLMKMSRKLARNKARNRTIRKLPQTVYIVPSPKPSQAMKARRSLNGNKRLAYMILLGVCLGSLIFDLDSEGIKNLVQSVASVADIKLSFLNKS